MAHVCQLSLVRTGQVSTDQARPSRQSHANTGLLGSRPGELEGRRGGRRTRQAKRRRPKVAAGWCREAWLRVCRVARSLARIVTTTTSGQRKGVTLNAAQPFLRPATSCRPVDRPACLIGMATLAATDRPVVVQHAPVLAAPNRAHFGAAWKKRLDFITIGQQQQQQQPVGASSRRLADGKWLLSAREAPKLARKSTKPVVGCSGGGSGGGGCNGRPSTITTEPAGRKQRRP